MQKNCDPFHHLLKVAHPWIKIFSPFSNKSLSEVQTLSHLWSFVSSDSLFTHFPFCSAQNKMFCPIWKYSSSLSLLTRFKVEKYHFEFSIFPYFSSCEFAYLTQNQFWKVIFHLMLINILISSLNSVFMLLFTIKQLMQVHLTVNQWYIIKSIGKT